MPKPKAPRGPKETQIQATILTYLLARGDVFAWRNNTGAFSPRPGQFMRYGTPGSADILGVWAPTGQLLAIEVKRPGGKLNPDQEAWSARVRSAGGVYLLATSVEDVEHVLGQPKVRVVFDTRRVLHGVVDDA